jgi:Holliday junction DNA helicase RuvA
VIAQLRGTVLERGVDHVVLDVGGVGYLVTVSLHTLSALPAAGQTARLFTYLQVREDAMTLFGFATDEERTAFELCISVQQVGPKLAMSILSTLQPAELAAAVAAGDHARLQRIPGVGKKTAERLTLELRDKFEKAGITRRPAVERPAAERSQSAQAVASALVNLGYRAAEATRAAEDAVESAAGAPVADLIKRALRRLAE